MQLLKVSEQKYHRVKRGYIPKHNPYANAQPSQDDSLDSERNIILLILFAVLAIIIVCVCICISCLSENLRQTIS